MIQFYIPQSNGKRLYLEKYENIHINKKDSKEYHVYNHKCHPDGLPRPLFAVKYKTSCFGPKYKFIGCKGDEYGYLLSDIHCVIDGRNHGQVYFDRIYHVLEFHTSFVSKE